MDIGKINTVTDFEIAKDEICFKLEGKNVPLEMLEKLVCLDFLDLKVSFYILVIFEDGTKGSMAVTHGLADLWGKNAEELWELARVNTPRLFPEKIQKMSQVLSELAEQSLVETDDVELAQDVPMYVVSNYERHWGAGVILYDGLLDEVAKRFDSDLYILPSSIHDTIILPVMEGDESSTFAEMVSVINQNVVMAKEVLSDSVYKFVRGKGIVIAEGDD